MFLTVLLIDASNERGHFSLLRLACLECCSSVSSAEACGTLLERMLREWRLLPLSLRLDLRTNIRNNEVNFFARCVEVFQQRRSKDAVAPLAIF